jgi:hypothetical protein
MRIQTSDNVVVDGFDKIQLVVNKICSIAVVQNAAKKEDNNQITYNGHSIQVSNTNELAAQIPYVLDDMRLCSWEGKIFSKSSSEVFEEKFTKCLNFLLTWLKSIQEQQGQASVPVQVGIAALQMQSAIEWMQPIMKEYRSGFSENDFVCVEKMIDSL